MVVCRCRWPCQQRQVRSSTLWPSPCIAATRHSLIQQCHLLCHFKCFTRSSAYDCRHRYSLEDLRRYAQEGRWGLALGAAVARYAGKHRRVWVPLTQVRHAEKSSIYVILSPSSSPRGRMTQRQSQVKCACTWVVLVHERTCSNWAAAVHPLVLWAASPWAHVQCKSTW